MPGPSLLSREFRRYRRRLRAAQAAEAEEETPRDDRDRPLVFRIQSAKYVHLEDWDCQAVKVYLVGADYIVDTHKSPFEVLAGRRPTPLEFCEPTPYSFKIAISTWTTAKELAEAIGVNEHQLRCTCRNPAPYPRVIIRNDLFRQKAAIQEALEETVWSSDDEEDTDVGHGMVFFDENDEIIRPPRRGPHEYVVRYGPYKGWTRQDLLDLQHRNRMEIREWNSLLDDYGGNPEEHHVEIDTHDPVVVYDWLDHCTHYDVLVPEEPVLDQIVKEQWCGLPTLVIVVASHTDPHAYRGMYPYPTFPPQPPIPVIEEDFGILNADLGPVSAPRAHDPIIDDQD
jgi:hypothetical protein